MNKITSSVLVLATAASVVPSVFALTVPTRRPSVPSDHEKSTDAVRAANFKDAVMNVVMKYEERLTRYEEFYRKVQSRSGKIPHYKKLDFLNTAQYNLAETKRILALVRVRLNALDYTQEKRVLMPLVRTELTVLKNSFVTLHTSMASTVKTLKEGTL